MSGFHRSRRALALAAVTLLSSACVHFPSPKVWNLREVHYPDGRAKYVGDLRVDFEHLLLQSFDQTALGSPEFLGTEQKAIKDPFKACLKNVNGLSKCNRENPKTRARMVEMFAWLTGDCTYALSRERCVLELGDLGERVGVKEPKLLNPNAGPATALEVGEQVPLLFSDASPLVAGQDTPELRQTLAARCAQIGSMTLDREGAYRLLRVTNILLGRWRVERREAVDPLLRLHLDLERQCIALALGEALVDENPRVRAAAIRAGVQVTKNDSPELLLRALQDPSLEVRLEVMLSLREHGAPPPPQKRNPDMVFRSEAFWINQVVNILRAGTGGPLAVAGCKAMARLTGEPRDLRPEAWIVWWEDEGIPVYTGAPPPAGG